MKYLIIILIMAVTLTHSFAQDKRGAEDAKGLQVGTVAPLFKAVDSDNQPFDLQKALETGPVVLIFYRGQWCPICNRHLSQIQDSLPFITDKGANVIAVSPEKPEYLDKMAEKTGAKFTLLYDEGYKIENAYNVTFTPDDKQIFMYNTMLNAKLKESHSDDSQQLPIPATYIIGKDGKIVWRQFNPDYKKRSTVHEIINNLP
ncbi:MAG: peroxiredoxin-like family protein [Prolixibacteraceae bacterium]|jgi:peroxiredoxin|nr:peroxiredoxin-like family protein [Prolixibacteraceae bacterium]